MSLPGYEQALAMILEALSPLDAKTIPASGALGRVLAEDLTVPTDFPDQPRSAVDGFAVGSCDRASFTLVGEVAAGGRTVSPLSAHEAVAVMTGAVVPAGAVAVVMLEQTRVVQDDLTVDTAIEPGDLINDVGSEVRRGARLAFPGQRLDVASHAAIMGAGLTELTVTRRPRVGLLITGDEVHATPAPGAVFDADSYILKAVCTGLGCEVAACRHIGDDEAATRAMLAELATGCDLIVTSGGVSKGRYDHVGHILRNDADRLLLQGTAIKPGRPLHVARLEDDTPIFGMPGYPTALLTNAFLYLVPALKTLGGRRDVATRWLAATLNDPLRYRPDRLYLNRATLSLKDGIWFAGDPGSQMSSHFLNFTQVQGLVRMPLTPPPGQSGGSATLAAGQAVTALHFALELS